MAWPQIIIRKVDSCPRISVTRFTIFGLELIVPALTLGAFPHFPWHFMSPHRRSGGAAKKSSRPAASDSAPARGPAASSGRSKVTRELLSRARQGDGESLGELLTLYRNYLSLMATTQLERRLRPRVSPSDIVQETMLKAHRHFAQFKGCSEAEFLAWLRQILLSSLAHFVERHLLAAKRNIRREISIEDCADLAGGASPGANALGTPRGESPSTAVRQREASQILSDHLGELSPRYREVLLLRNIQGLSFDEIAIQFHCTPAAVRMLWLRAIQKLRAIYRGAGEHDV
jgi:RNA polymerase sigma-70 factor, ECF subfamily